MPGSKVRATSVAHIAFELAAIRLAYGTGAWRVAAPGEARGAAAPPPPRP
jgi:hypothetical protein